MADYQSPFTGQEVDDAVTAVDFKANGPASSTDGGVARYSGTTGKILQDGPGIGTSANNLVQLDGTAKLPAVDGSQLTGVGDVVGPSSTTENKIPQWDTASKTLKDGLTAGTAANNLVQLDGSSRLPAVDGSQLTNLPSTPASVTVSPAITVNNQLIDDTYDVWKGEPTSSFTYQITNLSDTGNIGRTYTLVNNSSLNLAITYDGSATPAIKVYADGIEYSATSPGSFTLNARKFLQIIWLAENIAYITT